MQEEVTRVEGPVVIFKQGGRAHDTLFEPGFRIIFERMSQEGMGPVTGMISTPEMDASCEDRPKVRLSYLSTSHVVLLQQRRAFEGIVVQPDA